MGSKSQRACEKVEETNIVKKKVRNSTRGKGGAEDVNRATEKVAQVPNPIGDICKNFLLREHVLRERGFVERLNESHDSHMRRLCDTQEKVALLDSQFLQQKQQLVRAREMEECQLHESHQLAKRQLKDMFFLQWH